MRKDEPNTSLGLAGRHLLGETPATRICHTLLVPPNDSLPSGTNPKSAEGLLQPEVVTL